jgi:glycosyltransferase involved in cell wall biosynthesis
MHLVINCNVTPTSKTGVGQYIEQLSHALQTTSPKLKLTCLVDKQKPDVLILSSVDKVGLPFRPTSSYKHIYYQPHIVHELKRLRADVYHLPNTSPLLLKACPTVITIHDLQEFFIDKYGIFRSLYRKIVNWFASRRADAVITVSQHAKRTIADKLKIPLAKIHAIGHGRSEIFRLLPNDNFHSVPIQKPYLISVGQLQPGKNYMRLLDAFAQSHLSNFSLIIVGSKGWEHEKLFMRATKPDLVDRVIFLEQISTEELVRLYNYADLCVYPSLYEGFGFPALEAMACGVPVIAANNSSLPEVLGNAGRYFNPYDTGDITKCLNEVMGKPSLRDEMRHQGLLRVKEFTWEKTAQETIKIYRSVL